ncbi:hypothetical protein [Cellulophaga baltica]|uniref:hypothetical protein n=1 Tax=Cellulophaga baltica TaxID=76594 RepID=UPI00041A09C6|nr:hypothetical protein [Cellulophaga baltica]AIY14037.1 hypothetical protein M667_12965 [Cellulophaga baltica NN016038]
MGKVICRFCNINGEKSKEHIWPRWLQKHLIGNTKSHFKGIHLGMPFGTISERNQSGESLVYGNICTICNNGWMAELENKFRPIYLEIESDYNKIKHLSKSERRVICLWGLKTAMMINAGTNYRQIIPDSHFNHLFKYRELPKDIKVDICFFESDSLLMWNQSNISFESFKTTDYEKSDPYDLRNNSYVISLQINKIGIKIIHYHGLKEKKYQIPLDKNESNIRIWPYQKNESFKLTNPYDSISSFHINTRMEK